MAARNEPQFENDMLRRPRRLAYAWKRLQSRLSRLLLGYDFRIRDFSYSATTVAPGDVIFVKCAVQNTGTTVASFYARFVIYTPYVGFVGRALEQLGYRQAHREIYDSDTDKAMGRSDVLLQTELQPTEVRDFAYAFVVPQIPDLGGLSRTYFTFIEIWSPSRRLGRQQAKSSYPDLCFDQAVNTRLDIARRRDKIKLFISYAHDDTAHWKWLTQLAEEFEKHGFEVWLDGWQMDAQPIDAQVDHAIENADAIVLIGSDRYCRKWTTREGGVGKEANRICALLSQATAPVVALVRAGAEQSAIDHVAQEIGGRLFVEMTSPQWRGHPFGRLVQIILTPLFKPRIDPS